MKKETLKNDSHERTYILILEEITHKIRDGKLKPGEKLPSERSLSEEFGVSRSTIREAMRAMELIGLVNCRQGDGNFLAEEFTHALVEPLSLLYWLQNGNMNELIDFRSALEKEAVLLTIDRAENKEIQELNENILEIEKKETPQEKAYYCNQVHRLIGKLSQNNLIRDTLSSTITLMSRIEPDFLAQIFKDSQNSNELSSFYRSLAEALRQRQTIEAVKEMQNIMDLLKSVLK